MTVAIFALASLAVVIGGLLVFVIGLAIWTRRGESRGDAPGTRTLCQFEGPAAWGEDGDLEEGVWPGEGLITRIAEELRERGVAAENIDLDDSGWACFAERDGESAYLLLTPSADPEHSWLLNVLEPSSGGPGPANLLQPVHEALQGLEGVVRIRWYARERFGIGDPGPGAPYPLDE
jgi:hypothetical protein